MAAGPMPREAWTLARDAHGRLVLTQPDGTVHEGVVPVRAFPIAAPDDGIAMIGADGHECAWIDRLPDLDEPQRTLVADELARREFMPLIARLVAVSTFSTPSTWSVDTDRGRCDLILKGEEDLRRLPDGGLLVTDNHGVVYRIRELAALDRASRRLLDRFL